MQSAEIRFAELDDARRIREIYAPYVSDTALTFTSSVPSLESLVQTMLDIKKNHPYLVCSIGGKVVGFAYAYRLRPHEAYNWNAELTIYIDPDYQRCGIATALYTSLLQILKLQGFCNLYALITVPNEPSVALHRHFGFKDAGVLTASGYKLGAWHDVLWMEMRIPDCLDPATHGMPTPVSDLNANDVATILAMSSALLAGADRRAEAS